MQSMYKDQEKDGYKVADSPLSSFFLMQNADFSGVFASLKHQENVKTSPYWKMMEHAIETKKCDSN